MRTPSQSSWRSEEEFLVYLKAVLIEINPLFVYENQVKAIDAVIAVGN